MADRKVLVGKVANGIPTHENFDIGDALVDPLGFSISEGSASSSDFYKTINLVGTRAGFIVGDSLVLAIAITQSTILPANGAGSLVYCYIPPIAQTSFTINKVTGGPGGTSVEVGAIVFAPNSKIGVLNTYSLTIFETGDIFEIYAPPVTNNIEEMTFSFAAYMLQTTNPAIPTPGNIVSTGNYTYTGGDELVQIPANCINLSFKAWGAGGTFYGGAGGYIQGMATVTEGDWLLIKVGGAGQRPDDGNYAGGGGGMSSVFNITTNEYIFIAGGGGGGTYYDDYGIYYLGQGGAAGGLTGQDGIGATPGTGGTQLVGGLPGGILYQGADAVADSYAHYAPGGYNGGGNGAFGIGGGGGGGYYGGGYGQGEHSESTCSGGGGGSSMVPSGGLTLAGNQGLPANSSDVQRSGAGEGGVTGTDGIIYIIYTSS